MDKEPCNPCPTPNSLLPRFDRSAETTTVDTNGGMIAGHNTGAFSRVIFNWATNPVIIGVGDVVDTSNPLMIVAGESHEVLKFDELGPLVGESLWAVATVGTADVTVTTIVYRSRRT